MIVMRTNRHQARFSHVIDQTHGFSRRAESGFHFGTNRNPLHVLPEHVHQKMIPFMAAVKPDGFTQEAAADPQPYGKSEGRLCRELCG